jgi:hypothetical protein
MNESPRKRFQSSQHAKRILDITSDPAVIAALDASILQMADDAGTAADPQRAMAMHWQLSGARKLRDYFLTIAVVEKPKPKISSDNLSE